MLELKITGVQAEGCINPTCNNCLECDNFIDINHDKVICAYKTAEHSANINDQISFVNIAEGVGNTDANYTC